MHVHNLLQFPSALAQTTLNNNESNQNICTGQQTSHRFASTWYVGFQYYLVSIKNIVVTYGRHDRASVEPLYMLTPHTTALENMT